MMGDQIVIVPEQHQLLKEDKIVPDYCIESSQPLKNEHITENEESSIFPTAENFQLADATLQESPKVVCGQNSDLHFGNNQSSQFVCEMCNNIFDISSSYEDPIIRNKQLLATKSMNNEHFSSDNDNLNVCKARPQINKDFFPIHLGKWSKVICELRHRFDQTLHIDHKQPDVLNFVLLADQTFPKTIQQTILSVENNSTNLTVLENKCFQLPTTNDHSTSQHSTNNKVKTDETLVIINSEIRDVINKNDITNLSEPLLISPLTDDNPKKSNKQHGSNSSSNESATCQIDKSKVYLDFVTRLLYCESCLTTFSTIDQALVHFKTDEDSDKSADQYAWDEYDIKLIKRSEEKLQMLQEDNSTKDECSIRKMTNHQEVENTDHTEELNLWQNDKNHDALLEDKKFSKELKDSSVLKQNWNDQHEDDSLSSNSEKVLLFEKNVERKKKKRKNRKKKKKAWRILKSSIIHTIAFLF